MFSIQNHFKSKSTFKTDENLYPDQIKTNDNSIKNSLHFNSNFSQALKVVIRIAYNFYT